MSWLKDVWDLVEKVATLTKDSEQASNEIKELRRDLNSLTIAVTELKSELEHHRETTKLVLEKFEGELGHAKESIAIKFEFLTGRLEGIVSDFENRLRISTQEDRSHLTIASGNPASQKRLKSK